MRVGQLQKLNELRAAAPFAHQSENLARQQVDGKRLLLTVDADATIYLLTNRF
jgi:hypothetical protein